MLEGANAGSEPSVLGVSPHSPPAPGNHQVKASQQSTLIAHCYHQVWWYGGHMCWWEHTTTCLACVLSPQHLQWSTCLLLICLWWGYPCVSTFWISVTVYFNQKLLYFIFIFKFNFQRREQVVQYLLFCAAVDTLILDYIISIST